jgi:ArsR family transcriptional regulator
MLPKTQIENVAALFQCLGNVTRARILHALFSGELCVCDLAQILGLSVSAISHQLRLLRSLQLVKFRKAGKMAYYSIDDEHVRSLFALGLDHVRHR